MYTLQLCNRFYNLFLCDILNMFLTLDICIVAENMRMFYWKIKLVATGNVMSNFRN